MKTKLERIQQDLENLQQFNATPEKGLTRFSLTEEDRGAREYLRNELKKLGLEVYEDPAGSLFGRREGTEDLPAIIIGSHFDSVKNGGHFDGPAGVIMALEIMRTLKDQGVKTRYPIEFIAMIEEEGGRFGSGVFGSRAMAGLVDYDQLLQRKDADGVSMAEAFEAFGFNPKEIAKARRTKDQVKAFIELHIEQGPILESGHKDVGIVEFIVGITQLKVVVRGRPDHAGTTPMAMRADPLVVASKVIARIPEFPAAENNGSVATVGVLEVKPGASNIVPESVTLTVDIRSKNQESIDRIIEKITIALDEASKDSKVSYETEILLGVKPVPMAPAIVDILKDKAQALGFSYEMMLSGAGHDAMIMGLFTDVGLIFVPSLDGRSHCPEEWTDYDQLQKGIEVIYETILQLGEAVQ
jgi:allantoate deiminase